jgi:hypothetical protein
MSHDVNWREYGTKADQAAGKEVVEIHDGIYGSYKTSTGGKPTSGTASLPNTPSPFTLKK